MFDAAGTSITCGELSLTGTATKKTEASITLEAAYNSCELLEPFKVGVTVNMNGCDYVFKANGEVAVKARAGHNCAYGNEAISFGTFGCELTIGEKGNGALKGVTYHNIGSEANNTAEITAEPNVVGINYKSEGFLCPKAGEFSDGAFTTGNATITAETDPGGVMAMPGGSSRIAPEHGSGFWARAQLRGWK